MASRWPRSLPLIRPRSRGHIKCQAHDPPITHPLRATRGPGAPCEVQPAPKAQLMALCMARLSDPINYTQIFPYINEFIGTLHVTDDPARMGFYSGLVDTGVHRAIAATLTVFHWAKLSDIIGRRPVILGCSLGMSMVSSLFGLCRSFPQLLALRAITGLLAGNGAVYQTILAELTDSTNQGTAYPIFGGIYPLGATVGPLLGGFFSNVATKYPKYFGYSFLESYPYFLPGFICALVALLGFCMTYCFLEEVWRQPTVCRRSRANAQTRPKLIQGPHQRRWHPRAPVHARDSGREPLERRARGPRRRFTVVFVLFCYTPIETGGLGFSAREIGYAMAMSSGSFAALQLLVMPILMRRFDPLKMYLVYMGLWPLTFLLLPLLNVIARMGGDNPSSKIKAFLWLGIALVVLCWRVACLAYPINGILVRNNAPTPASLGAVNGLNYLAMGLSRCSSPATIFALSVDNHLLGGNLWVGVMVAIAGLGLWVSTRVPRESR
ncbi:major facilitator superfamily domain-containing protein [Mycena rosella]|uniref:Major facilitator superfamily domain-containing protein n=1 Tax=Mycena rosella TaxID=1033263 RepID=A0AAD7CXN8_MYCRO|nr:major facilitator superfamily domain-containing protein [Mycena rosella]